MKGKGCYDHAVSLRNIGWMKYNNGQHEEALKFYKNCLEIKKKIKGKDCLDTAIALSHMGYVYLYQGNY